MSGAGLRIAVDERVATVTIDRPDVLNALNTSLLEELLATLTDLGNDPGVGVVILTGEGERSFIAGAPNRLIGRPSSRLHSLRHGQCANRARDGVILFRPKFERGE